MAAVLEAHIDHGGHTADDQDDNGNDQVDDLAIGIKLHLSGILKGTLRRGIEVALGGVELVGAHGAVIDVEAGHHNDEHQGQDGVVVEGDGPQEDLEADLLIADYAGNGRRPGGDGHHDTHRRRSGIAHVGQLGAGDVVAVGHGAHHVAGGQVVEVVIHTQHNRQDEGGPQGAGFGLDVGHSPVAVGLGAAGPDHQGHHGAQDDQEHQDTHVAAGIGAQVADKELERVDGIAVDLQEAANQDTQEQRRVDFLGDQRQADGHDGRQQGRDGTVNRADNLSVTFCECGCGKNTCKGEYDEQEFPKVSHAW